MAEELFPHLKWDQLLAATQETLCTTALSRAATLILGIVFGLVLFLAAHGGLSPGHAVYSAISLVVNTLRSTSFIILIVLFIPSTKVTIGTILGTNTTLPALIMGITPFYVCLIEIALREVDKNVIETTRLMGVRLSALILRVLLPESSPALVSGITVTLIALVSYSSMAGVVGTGDLENLAYLEGFQRNRSDTTLVATVAILPTVFIIQLCGDMITSSLDKRQ